jgi:2-polyprenyl-6-hydroxyphenyl methylase/3-demethylubiquinone-9 3-methyltransferase
MKINNPYIEYHWKSPETCAHRYIVPIIVKIIQELKLSFDAKILDTGCGGGSLVYHIYKMGFKNVYGFDISSSGIDLAKKSFPELESNFFVHDVYDPDLPFEIPQKYDVIISMEVIEHLYSPKTYLKNITIWLKDDGYLILTTPFHGYLKNLLISLLNKFDSHFNPLAEGGHIKFFSKNTLCSLFKETGIKPLKFYGVGRIPFLWKSMILLGRRYENFKGKN